MNHEGGKWLVLGACLHKEPWKQLHGWRSYSLPCRSHLQHCYTASEHFFQIGSNSALLSLYWGTRLNIIFFSSFHSLSGNPGSFRLPFGVHLFITSTPNTASCAILIASFPAELSLFNLGYFFTTSLTGISFDLSISVDGRAFALTLVIGSGLLPVVRTLAWSEWFGVEGTVIG